MLARLAQEAETAILLVEHKTDLLARSATRIVVLDGGRVARVGAVAEVLADPDLPDMGVEPPADVRLRRRLDEAGLERPDLRRRVEEALS